MKTTNGSSRKQIRWWISLGLLAGVALMGTLIANAEKRTSGSFQAVESGINHKDMPVDSHHICGIGMHSALGHYTACIALETPTKGIIEYQFASGDAIYGTVELKARTSKGPWMMDIEFKAGTGQFGHVSGHATGYMKCAAKDCGVQTYTVALDGYFESEKLALPPRIP